jgi:hypothetical protein
MRVKDPQSLEKFIVRLMKTVFKDCKQSWKANLIPNEDKS